MFRPFLIFLIIGTLCLASCSHRQSRYAEIINSAEKGFTANTDSVLALLDGIDAAELTTDSLKAKYEYLRAWGHLRQNRSMISDSLIAFAHEYYRGKDLVKDLRTGTALAWYKFWVGDTPGAIALLDSLVALGNVPDSLMLPTVRIRTLLGASEYQGRELISVAKRLIELETDPMRQLEAKYLLAGAYEYAGELDSALALVLEAKEYAAAEHMGEKQFSLELERAQILTEMGRNSESDAVIDEIFALAGRENGAADYLHMQRAINALNTGKTALASKELAIADSLAASLRNADDAYYRSYSNLIHTMIEFNQTGRMKLAHVNRLNNRQMERFNRMRASQWESERGALNQQQRALALKAESEHKTVIILVIALVALIVFIGAAWIIMLRRRRERENEERIEALQKMVDEFNATPAQSSPSATPALRRAMLQQLGIIKMVAETPTEQNREMLRKISSIDGDTNGALVNWSSLFELINNLYGGFYNKLHSAFGEVLNEKEEQIIVLMTAGFSTKEISVITGQTTATIYVRKSSIRKKLGTTEKEDIVLFLRNAFS